MLFKCLHKRRRPHDHPYKDVALLAARLTVAALFLPAGIGKLFGLSGYTAMLARASLFPTSSPAWLWQPRSSALSH
jgi:uncharacterized membrane protein YphA (DoxX/SURF4 family)